ncbi:MAG: hypothetical protein EXQ58_05325 [Acidobacteria bacterium]|nr:hypothetical protein [Acidobacteriota bacterium]
MKLGGETLKGKTDARGIVRTEIPRLDQITNIHHSIQLVARFNADRRDPDYQPVQTPQCEFYSLAEY